MPDPAEPTTARGAGSPATSTLRRWAFPASQAIAVLLASAAGWYAYTIVRENRHELGDAALWILACAGLMSYVAWDGARPHLERWPNALLAYVREHPVELGLLALICAMGVFTRIWTYGTLPPDNFVFFEEHIYGGVQWDILQGDRTYIYIMHNYLGALSQHLFGPNTNGLRMHTVIAGILSVPFFYLMMREVTGRAGSLFATAVYASLRSVGDINPPHQTLFLGEVILVWTALRAVNTRNLVWLVPASLAAAILSYEYESAKAVPLLLAAFLVWLAVRGLLWPIPLSTATIWERIRQHGPHIARGALVVTVVVVAALGPMVSETKRGKDIYFGSLDRNQADRGGGRFAPDWRNQLEASVRVYTPWVEPNFQSIGSIAAGGIIDRMTSVWIWAAVVAGVAMFWRGHRALFIGWFLSGIVMSSLLLSNWAPWKMVGWLVPAIALTGLLADDMVALARRYSRSLMYAAVAVLAGVVAVAFTLNVRQLDKNAHNPNILREWSNNPSYPFSICDNLRRRPDDTFGVVSQRTRSAFGFGAKIETLEDAKKLWGDFRFVCDGLVGVSVANLQEAWPFVATEDRPYTLIQPAIPGENEQIVNALARAMPELGPPDERIMSPADVFEVIIYDVTRDDINARRGLVLQWLDAAGSPIGDPIITSTFDQSPPAGAAQFAITGLVSTNERFNGFLGPVEPAAGLTIMAEKQPLYADGAGIVATITPGWHLVDIRGSVADGVPERYAWSAADGSVYDVQPDVMFALEDQEVWLHLREIQPEEGAPLVVMRYDFEPHTSATNGIRIDATTPAPAGARIVRDYYRGYWMLATADRFTFQTSTGDQSIELKIDGQTVIYRTPSDGTPVGTVQLGPGEHLIEVTYSEATGPYAGGYIWATSNTTGEVVPIRVRPFTSVPPPP